MASPKRVNAPSPSQGNCVGGCGRLVPDVGARGHAPPACPWGASLPVSGWYVWATEVKNRFRTGDCMQTLGLGFTWEQLSPGQRFRTLNRTVTETDLVMFTGITGMLETIFIDRTFAAEKGGIEGQFVPAALPYGLIEGLLCQSMIQG